MKTTFRAVRFGVVLIAFGVAAGCRPTEPEPVATLNGQSIKSATCNNSIVTPTVNSCKKAVLEKCRPGATVLTVGEQSRLVYRHPGWATQLIWTVLLKNC